MNTLKQTKGKYLMVLIAMCGLVSSTIGILTNAAGIFFTPIAQDLGLGDNITAVSLMLTIANLVFAVAGLLAARVVNPRRFKPMVIVFTALCAGGTAALALCHDLASLYVLSAVRGFAAGMISNVVATTVLGEWFHSDTGLISSLALGSTGLIGALFNPILESVIRCAGWRAAYLASAAVIVALNLPAILLPIAMRPVDAGTIPLRVASSGRSAAPARPGTSANSESLAVLLIAVVSLSIASIVSAIPQLLKPIARSYGLEQTGVTMMSVVLVVNTGGKLVCGAMIDRLGVRRTLLIYVSGIVAGLLLLLLVHVPAVMLVSAALIGLIYAILTVGAVMLCRELFSPERYSRVFPKLNLGVSAANALGYPLLSGIHGATGSYNAALLLAVALMAMSMAGVLLAYRKARG